MKKCGRIIRLSPKLMTNIKISLWIVDKNTDDIDWPTNDVNTCTTVKKLKNIIMEKFNKENDKETISIKIRNNDEKLI